MKSKECLLSGKRSDIDKALKEVEKFAQYNDLSHKEILQLRLLAEEMMGMQAGVMGFVKGKLYLENQGQTYTIYLHTKIDVSKHQAVQEKLVELSTSGKNSAYTGFMGRIRKLMDNMASNSLSDCYFVGNGMGDTMSINSSAVDYEKIWKLSKYKEKVKKKMEQWDELEKSIVASIADELVVGSRNDYIDLIAVKNFK